MLELCGSDRTALHLVLRMVHHSTAFIQEVAKSRSVAGETIVVIPCPTQVVVSEHGLHELCSGDLMELGPYTQVNPLPTCWMFFHCFVVDGGWCTRMGSSIRKC